MTEAEDDLARTLETGRSTENRAAAATTPSIDDPEVARIVDRYQQLGSEPPRFTVARNDEQYRQLGAHTIDRHGPDMQLPRAQSTKTEHTPAASTPGTG